MIPWTDEERQYIRERYISDGVAACAQALGRSQKAVRNQGYILGVSRKLCTNEERPVNHPAAVAAGRYSTAEVAHGLGCSEERIDRLAREMRIVPTLSKRGVVAFSGFDIARFAVENALWIDQNKARIDMVWLIDLVGRLGPVSIHACEDRLTERVVSLALARNDLTLSAIAEALGTTPKSVGVMISNARGRGIAIPRRRSLHKAA